MINIVNALTPLEDASGNGNNFINSVNAVYMNGFYNLSSSGYLRTNYSTSFNNISYITISMDYLYTGVTYDFSIVWAFFNATNDFMHVNGRISPTGNYYYKATNSTSAAIQSSVVGYYKYNEWHKYVFTVNSTSMAIWRDGTLVSQTPFYGGLKLNTNQLFGIGHNILDPTYYAYGLFDNITIWNRGFTDAEVLALNNTGIVNTTGLVAYYPFTNSTTSSCVYGGSGDFVISNSICNITSNYTMTMGTNFNITNSTIYIVNSYVKGYSFAHWFSGWLHMVKA